MDHAQTMAEWEPQHCIYTEIDGGLATEFLGTRCMDIFDSKLCAIGLALDVAIEMRETLQEY